MQTLRRRPRMSSALSAIAAIAITSGLVAGCSSSSTEVLPDAATLLQDSSKITKGLTSAHVEIVVSGKIDGLPVKRLSGDLTNVPTSAAQGETTITMAGSDLDAQVIVTGGTLYATLSPDSWIDFGPAADIYDPSIILNPDHGLSHLLTSFADPKAEAGDKINDIDTVKVTGQVSAEAVNQILPRLKADAPVPGTAWIEKAGDHKLVRTELTPSSGNSIEVTMSDWNKPVTVTKPQV